jgi:hypothetical protein
MHDVALGAGQADVSQTRSSSLRTRVKDVLILVANSFSRGPAYYQTGFSGTCRTRIVLISEFATSICSDAVCHLCPNGNFTVHFRPS